MTDNALAAAYAELCAEAEQSTRKCVSLYSTVRAYGGPEEGGWWYDIAECLASQWCSSEAEAEALKARCQARADELTLDALARHGEYCLRSMDFLEARGLDADYLPEPDGAAEYWIAIEDRPGEFDNTREGRPTYC